MPIVMGQVPPGPIVGTVPAPLDVRVTIAAPAGSDVSGVPAPSVVVAWVLVGDPLEAGGARLEPVFLAGGRAWTPDQYRAAYGQRLTVNVARD
ncbi:hypothetical protein [Streptomyces sp. NPDC005953]|uniref:hypothetical protein n=1 Tax=Streptomyces sp. NPDC005953 TaxID=3156719 RepID=UPI0033EE17BC